MQTYDPGHVDLSQLGTAVSSLHWNEMSYLRQTIDVRTPIPSHIDLAGNTSYHFAASCTVFHGCRLTMAQDRLRLLAHVYDSVASIHMTENPGRHG